MRKVVGVFAPFMAASLAPGAVFSLYVFAIMIMAEQQLQVTELRELLVIGTIAWLVSAMHVVAFGLPSVYLLHKLNRLRGWTVCLAGFVGGMIPLGVWSWPLRWNRAGSTASHWDGREMVTTMVDGIPTLAGWLSYLKGLAMTGALGVVAGMTFWLVWRRLHSPSRPDRPTIPPMLVPADMTSKLP